MPDSQPPTIQGGRLLLGPATSVFGTPGYYLFSLPAGVIPPAPPAGFELYATGTIVDGAQLLIYRPAKVAPPAPPPPPVVVKPVVVPDPPKPDPTIVQVPASGDLRAALALMADGKTLELQAGGSWPGVNIPWTWSHASIVSYGSGPAPIIGGLTLKAACTDVDFTGFKVKGSPGAGWGVSWQAAKTERVTFDSITVEGFATCYSVITPNHEKAPPEMWHKDIKFVNCRAIGARPAHPQDWNDYQGQGWYMGEVDGLTFDGCHADDCGGMNPANNRRHGWYLSQFIRELTISDCAATRCSSYGIQSRSDGADIIGNAVAECGMGIMCNGATGTVQNNTVIRGHAHSDGPWGRNGRGAFDLHMGSGTITGNVVANGPTPLPAGFFQPLAFNLGYRETKLPPKEPNQPWEWIKLFPNGQVRPLATMGAGNIDNTSKPPVVVNFDKLLALAPNGVAAAIAGAAR